MTTLQLKNTLYRQWVRASVYHYMQHKKPHFTIKEFAEYAQTSVTMNLRRRLKEMVLAGELQVDFALMPTKGSCHVYTVVQQ